MPHSGRWQGCYFQQFRFDPLPQTRPTGTAGKSPRVRRQKACSEPKWLLKSARFLVGGCHSALCRMAIGWGRTCCPPPMLKTNNDHPAPRSAPTLSAPSRASRYTVSAALIRRGQPRRREQKQRTRSKATINARSRSTGQSTLFKVFTEPRGAQVPRGLARSVGSASRGFSGQGWRGYWPRMSLRTSA